MDISNVDSVLNQFSIRNRQSDESENGDDLGRDVFLQLLTTQLQNQNPLEPQENSEFVAQLAQFTQVESLDELSNNFSDFTGSFLSNQALAASSLVGTSVTVPSSSTLLSAGGVVSGRVELPTSSPDVNISIFDDNGSLIDRIPLGEQASGELIFRWDGLFAELNGELLDWQSQNAEIPPGEYEIRVTALIGGESTQLDTGLSANVNSVTVGNNNELTLNLAGIGSFSIDDVIQFNQ
ncbi:flagellar hook assembly protein FlgD [Sessilibacter corallicola]|uniref:flagellar hook assembly protein FlgD n=1 Tax=Sessilibacter corallicola TaxID=2904075 RepID=UPI001E58D30B|nr:flagellar hook assembly protein FlgD [Sessilibacter corallicola]MCE2029979.1 flagellar hook assembly protein FlgD [Sessilibacter corallicola]